MSSLKTKEYKLNKWKDEDFVNIAEFNDNFDKIDEKLKFIEVQDRNIFSKIESLKKEVDEKILEVKKTLKDKQNILENNINDLRTSLSQNTNNIKVSFERKILDLKNQINNEINLVKNNINDIKKLIQLNKTKIDQQNTSLSNLDAEISKFDSKNTSSINTINSKLRALENIAPCLNNSNSTFISTVCQDGHNISSKKTIKLFNLKSNRAVKRFSLILEPRNTLCSTRIDKISDEEMYVSSNCAVNYDGKWENVYKSYYWNNKNNRSKSLYGINEDLSNVLIGGYYNGRKIFSITESDSPCGIQTLTIKDIYSSNGAMYANVLVKKSGFYNFNFYISGYVQY